MSSMNFHSIKNIGVPEELREKVLAIPEQTDRKPVAAYYRSLRFAVAAASLVIITAVSVILFLNMGGRSPVVVQPSPTERSLIATEPSGGQPGATRESSNVSTSESPTSPTVPKNGASVAPSRQSAADRNREAVAPTRSPATERDKTAPTDAPATQPAVADPTAPPAETQAPWNPQPPTMLPWEEPTEAWLEPTEGTWTPPRGVSTTIRWSDHPKDGKVYCRIESPEGEVFGDYDLFAEERLMINIGSAQGSYIYVYWFKNHIEVPFKSENDVFKCIIYGSDGNELTTARIHWVD